MSPDPDAGARLKARGLRIALAVTAALAIEALRGADLPILAPMIALQILAMAPRAPGLKLLGMLFGAAAVSSLVAWTIAAFTVSIPGAYPLGMGVLYLWCFALAMHPRTRPLGAMALTMTIVVGALSAASTEAAAGLALSLAMSILAGGAVVYLAFAVLPGPPAPPAAAAGPEAADDLAEPRGPAPVPVAFRAALATMAMLPLHLWLTADGGVAAMPVLFTCSAMLRQPGVAASLRDSLARLAGTAAGGAAAAGVHAVTLMQDEATLALAMVAAASLAFAWRMSASPLHAQVWLPGFVTFLALYGMTLSPTLGGDEVAASERLGQVFAGAVYTVAAVSVLAPVARRLTTRRAARPA
ncbi:FUSC family protein [Albimonas pacifica]|uniref:Fusaric acid resistance protein-like n=1 Tax=Albimonas pacifica TaxID=1114924 RepID=A0A1I3PM61_9RHOB|nr:FUSC family protein [Albimonas pacifica]SFJ22430.1 Fusaric acid resistance protein-like [Albimonas pacifica]